MLILSAFPSLLLSLGSNQNINIRILKYPKTKVSLCKIIFFMKFKITSLLFDMVQIFTRYSCITSSLLVPLLSHRYHDLSCFGKLCLSRLKEKAGCLPLKYPTFGYYYIAIAQSQIEDIYRKLSETS